MHNHSYENEFNLHVKEISFSYEKMGTKTRFEEEAKGNSEMAYCMTSGLKPNFLKLAQLYANRLQGGNRFDSCKAKSDFFPCSTI